MEFWAIRVGIGALLLPVGFSPEEFCFSVTGWFRVWSLLLKQHSLILLLEYFVVCFSLDLAGANRCSCNLQVHPENNFQQLCS